MLKRRVPICAMDSVLAQVRNQPIVINDIMPKDLKARLDAGEALQIIDVREYWEVNLGTIEGAIHIPMNDIPYSLDEIPDDKPVIFMCHTGVRSAQVTEWVKRQGRENVLNLVGGIERWSREIDPSIPRY